MAFLSMLFIFCLLVVLILWRRHHNAGRQIIPPGLKSLPGPKGYPLLGSVPDVPEKNSYIKFSDWGKEYGPIYQVNLAGHNHVWISTDQIARDLLAKKGAIYSDRPHIPALIDDNRTSSQYLPLLSKNEGWTRQRKFASHIMRESEAACFYRYPEIEAKRMLVELLDEPDRYNHALESFISRVTCRLAWGHSEASDELKQRARELLIGVSPTGALGNKLPFLMSLPDWLVPAKAWERRRAGTERRFFEIMQDEVEQDIRQKQAPQSWMRSFLDNRSKWGFTYALEGAYAVGMHGIAGALTIAAPMQTFCLAMCHYPQYLSMLQEELDRVCGDRLPRAEDRPNLPFLRAIIRECIRWRPPVPTGIPHYLTQDDDYDGYHIPKGSVIHPLEWAIARDPVLYPDPKPSPLSLDRAQLPNLQRAPDRVPDHHQLYPIWVRSKTLSGQSVADEDMFIGIGSVAWLFNIGLHADNAATIKPAHTYKRSLGMNEKASVSNEELNTGIDAHDETTTREVSMKKKKDHEELDPTLDFSTLLIAKPLPFKFKLQPRSTERARKVRDLFRDGLDQGLYKESREYWGENQGKGKQFGWVKYRPQVPDFAPENSCVAQQTNFLTFVVFLRQRRLTQRLLRSLCH